DPAALEIPGVARRDADGSPALAPGRALVDVDGLPLPDRDLLPGLEVYPGTPVEEELRARSRLRGDYLDYRYAFADWRVALAYRLGRWAYRLSGVRRRR
ncbi:MAG: hypothetical protein AB1503_12400, partial [Bacillota bacterium]